MNDSQDKNNEDFHVASKVEWLYPTGDPNKSTESSEHTTSRILSQALTLRENGFANQPTSEFKALVVDEIDEESLVHGEQLGRATKPVPVRLVKITAENMSQMAILSWRWDGDLHSSRNIASAVHLAKAMSIKYLFVDQISIDQTLDGDALIERVLAFSTMYKTITVIVAYDKADEDFEKTVHRPWIFSEMRLYRYNLGQIIYVSHSNQGSKRHSDTYMVIPPIRGILKDLWPYDFGKHLGLNWKGTFLQTITRVLCEDIEMTSICDFKFIMPPYARVLSTAYETMSRNDYLLTAALLCMRHDRPSLGPGLDINEIDYKRYRFSKTRGRVNTRKFAYYDILQDGIKVAKWERQDIWYMGDAQYKFIVVLDAEGVILKALGLTDPEFLKEYALQKEARRSCLILPGEETVPLPTVRIASVTL